jgi:uncharacterized membrane protein YkvA (DUF1232 family)
MVCSLRRKYQSLIDYLKAKVRIIKIESYALAYVYRHKKTPWYAKLSIIITLGYLLSPIDLIPDCIPVLGYLDDLIIVPLLILLSIKLIPNDIFEECRKQAEEEVNTTAKQKKTAWWCAILIVLFYGAIICFIIYWLNIKRFSISNSPSTSFTQNEHIPKSKI